MPENREIGRTSSTCGYLTNYHDLGQGESVLLLHGTGGGVSGWVNWRGLIPALADKFPALWRYTPSSDNTRRAMSAMTHNQTLITEELIELRTRATMRPGAQETVDRVFPKPHQRWLDAQVLPIALLQAVEDEVLLIHGREDRVVPSEVSWRLHHKIPNSQLHMFGNCAHWTMIEQAARFQALVRAFLGEP